LVKTFDIREIATIQRLSASGYPLAYETVAVEGINTIIDALRSYLSGGLDRNVALVNLDDQGKCSAFGIMSMVGKCGVLEFIAPKPDDDEMVKSWAELSEAFVTAAGERGAYIVVAETPIDSNETNALAKAGFSPAIHQHVLKLINVSQEQSHSQFVQPFEMREEKKDDEPHIRVLAMRVVPKILQRADISTDVSRLGHRTDRGYVIFHEQECVGHISFRNGRRGYGLQLLFRQEVLTAESLQRCIDFALKQFANKADKPVYCVLPSYSSWLYDVLSELGFVLISENVLMIKNTTARIAQPVWSEQFVLIRGGKLIKTGDKSVNSDVELLNDEG
jgi:hypothetical protein